MENKNLEALRHTLAHVLAASVLELFPGSENAIGPAIDNGFYQDFEIKGTISEEDLPKIEALMRRKIKDWNAFERRVVKKEEAFELFPNNKYKRMLAEDFAAEGKTLTLHNSLDQNGEMVFLDLCKGGHLENPSKDINPDGFKLTHLAGAYWRGDEKNIMLTRVYGAAFETKEELDEYLEMQEETKKRDHRKLGKEMELFTFSNAVGAGLPLWLPKGEIIRHELEKWARETEKKWGYDHVVTPHITKKDLYEISGHLPYYKDDLYSPIDIEGEEYYLKPMNCPHTHMIYKNRPHSYRELPIRYAEYGHVYRFERSGTLHGLMRARGFCQNDAHIYVQPEKAVEEFVEVLKMHQYYYDALGVKDWWVVLGVRDKENVRTKYHGDDEMWDRAESMTKEALESFGIKYEIDEGGAAHYGPKADIYIRSVVGKEYAIGTDQLDLFMPKQFNLSYIDKDGSEKMPYIIHRAPLGSHERMVGFLLEHYAGKFPLWLSPVQIKILPIADAHKDYAEEIAKLLKGSDIRAELDEADETLGKKIRNWKLERVPYALVIGDEEVKSKKLKLESRDGKPESISPEKLVEKLSREIKDRK